MAEPIDLPFGLWTLVGQKKTSFGDKESASSVRALGNPGRDLDLDLGGANVHT